MSKPFDQELLPCPFCGGKPTVSNFPGAHNIWCSNQPAKCGNRSMYKVDEWQARASVQPVSESAEDRFEHYLQNAIDNAPDPLRRLGEYLSHVIDEDEWATAERMLNGAIVASARHPASG